MTDDAVKAYWEAYLASLPPSERAAPARYTAWGFGNTPEMADELGDLVVRGIKTATCSLFWEYEAGPEPLPQAGEMSIILNGAGAPICIIETLEIEIKPYNQVEAGFASEEGEGDRSLAYWRQAHWRFFKKGCQALGKELSESMPLVCERFKVVWVGEGDTARPAPGTRSAP